MGGGKVDLQQNKGWKWEVGIGEDEVPKIWKEYYEDLYNKEILHSTCVSLMGFRVVTTRVAE